MPGIAIIGAQWGDEGKGKVSNLLSREAEVVVRFNGGPNAGHTVVDGYGSIRLHHIPAGALWEGHLGVLAHGMVIDPWELREELAEISRQGRPAPRLLISERAHVILPYHREREIGSGAARRIGTTKRGIGPAYEDKVARLGLRFADLADQDLVRERVASAEERARFPGRPPLDPELVSQQLFEFYAAFREMIGDALSAISGALGAGKTVVFEGAQGTLLDVDFGTYPYVTSSTTTVHGIGWGTGISPREVGRIVGVAKAYATRVGEGPFPTEEEGDVGEFLRERGGEYGATTGRPRRCGWLDLVALRYAQRVNGFTELALTKLDVLSGLKQVKVCVAYRIAGERTDGFPPSARALYGARPIYEVLPGWKEEIREARSFEELPENARRFVRYVEEAVGVPIRLIGVGPGADEVILRD